MPLTPVRLVVLILLLSGCASTDMLPSSQKDTISPWNSYEEVKAAFDQITPGSSTVEDIQRLGFDPHRNANIQILTYVDIIRHFMPNEGIHKEDLAPAVHTCLEGRENCRAYAIRVANINRQRYGNVLLDLFNFRRRTHETGWEFTALIVLNNGLVVYTLSGGRPKIENYEDNTNPFGPFQSTEDVLRGAVRP